MVDVIKALNRRFDRIVKEIELAEVRLKHNKGEELDDVLDEGLDNGRIEAHYGELGFLKDLLAELETENGQVV